MINTIASFARFMGLKGQHFPGALSDLRCRLDDDAGEKLAEAVVENEFLRTLEVRNNGFHPKDRREEEPGPASVAFAEAFYENKTLESLNGLDWRGTKIDYSGRHLSAHLHPLAARSRGCLGSIS